MKMYDEKDYGDVVDEAGEVVGRAPKAWAGTDLLPPGHKVKGGRGGGSSSSGGSSAGKEDKPADGVPAKTETREVLEAYAVEKAGLTEEEAKAFGNKDELHAELVKRADAKS